MNIDKYLNVITKQDLLAPSTIIFGSGSLGKLGETAESITRGRKALVMTVAQSDWALDLLARAQDGLEQAGFEVSAMFCTGSEPTSGRVDFMAGQARRIAPAVIVGLGGGSVMDSAKAVAALVTNDGPVEDYLEGVGKGLSVEHDPLPVIAIPTTAGTGAEMTKNSVISNSDKQYKKSMRDARMIPTAAVVDPELMCSAPPMITAAAGMDAITQLIEPCISSKRKPATTELALMALKDCREALPLCCEQPNNLAARERMALASMISGVCLANSGLALAHGIASGMGAVIDFPHGLICGILLPHILRYNRTACPSEMGEALEAFLGSDAHSGGPIDTGIGVIETLNARLGLPPNFCHLNLDRDTVRRIAEKSMGSSMNGNPVEMTEDSVFDFLKALC